MKRNILLLTSLLVLTGCTSIYNSDKITVIKTRFFGLSVSYNPANQLPEAKLGWGSICYFMVPTSTNGPVYVPKYFDSYDLGQELNPFGTKIIENAGFGDVIINSDASGRSKLKQ